MPRRYRRRYTRVARPLKTVKYSNETIDGGDSFPVYRRPAQGVVNIPQYQFSLIAPISSQGMRKVKNFTLSFVSNSEMPLFWALVYVPEGNLPSILSIGTSQASTSLYEPNQNVIMSGLIHARSAQQTFRTRLARNLNSGDSIVLVWRQILPEVENYPTDSYTNFVTLNYAITY